MPLPEEVVTAVASTNFKNLGEAPAFYASIGMSNAISHQQAMNNIQLSAVGKITKYLTEADAESAVSTNKILSGNDLASQISALMSAIGGGQILSKTAGNTPPVTP